MAFVTWELWNRPSPNQSMYFCMATEIAAAYAYHIAESQAYLDGNKRTGIHAALDFLEINGVDTSSLPELAAYDAMIRVANHELDRRGLAQFFRATLAPSTQRH